MHAVGIDLAWGLRSPTGLAVVDDAGRLVRIAAARTDEEVVAFVEPFLQDGVVAGIDAPLIVVNPAGSRPAEQALGRDFRRFQAGCHPSNTGKPEFAAGTRGARVADLLGLTLDHEADGPRALEVYPHAATVALFDLPRILRYKAKPGRDLPLLRAELLRLMDLAAGVVDVGPQAPAHAVWAALRGTVEEAGTKAALRRVEDQVDAVVCAHVAWLAIHEPAALTTYGDPDTGVIVTPALPPDRLADRLPG